MSAVPGQHRSRRMRSGPTGRTRPALLAVVLVAALASGTVPRSEGAGAGAGGGEGPAGAGRAALTATADDRGSFSTPCAYSHSGDDDPIVHPGHEGMSHRHDFFGATTAGASSDVASLLAGGTTCRSAADRSAYWAPAVLDGGRPVRPVEVLTYYRVPVGSDALQVEPPPNGLEMIAGDAAATGPQDRDTVAWGCGLAEPTSPVPLRCPPGAELRLLLRFDPCWDGENLGSPDHRSHLAPTATGGACPRSHPVLIPELTMEVRYRTGGGAGAGGVRPAPVPGAGASGGEPLALASGPVTGGHGDVLVAWDGDHIATEVEVCLRANRRCDVVSESARLGFDHLTD